MFSAIHRLARRLTRPAIRAGSSVKRDQTGVTTVEFSLLIAPFCLTMISMIYLGLHHFGNAHFDMNVNSVMKNVYESVPVCPGQPSTAPYSASCLAQRICEQPNIIMVSAATCKAKIQVDFRQLAGDGTDTIPPLFTTAGLNSAALGSSSAGKPGDIVMVRAALPFPSWLVWGPFAHRTNGVYYLYATQVVRVRNVDTYNNVRVN
jgi:Flp pilus assembly pilin Flp